jgi:predicted DCC family thiol-disulfide oxidoreductase YuxK
VIVLFDGMCNLCSGTVQFIIKRDPSAKFRFASLQSAFGQRQLDKFNISKTDLHSVILLKGEKCLQKSDAALEVARNLSGLWPLFYALKILPRVFRDLIYSWIAKNRYAWFGKKASCWIPTPELRSRFID